jgi:hypothetical protein
MSRDGERALRKAGISVPLTGTPYSSPEGKSLLPCPHNRDGKRFAGEKRRGVQMVYESVLNTGYEQVFSE